MRRPSLEMENIELSKTSDEIINELFSSLNVPLSPKPVVVEENTSKGEQVSAHTGDSENSENEESDSKSSESEGETKTTVEVQENSKTDKAEKSKSQKKKKDKRKKKKKHKKKEDGGRHKHKKKKKKESFETAEEAKLAADVLQDVKVKNQAFIQKIIQEEFKQLDIKHCKKSEKAKSESVSPKLNKDLRLTDTPDRGDGVVEERRSHISHSDSNCRENLHENVPSSFQEKPLDSSSLPQRVSESVSKVKCSIPSGKLEESASKPVTECSLSHVTSPGSESVSGPPQEGRTVSGSHKRKESPHSHSPSPTFTKKIKVSNSSPSSKSSSPKTDSRQRSPSCTKRSRSGSVKDTKSESESKVRRSRSRSVKRSKAKRSRSRSRKRSLSKSRKSGPGRSKRSRSASKKRSRSGSRKRSRSRSRKRSRSKKRSRSRSKSDKRSGSKSKRKSRSKSRNRSRSVSRKRSTSKSRKSSQSKSRRSRSKGRSKSRSRKRSKSNSRRESASKSRRSRSRGRSKSKSRRSRSRSHSRRSRSQLKRSRSRSIKRSLSKSRRSRSRRKSGSQSRRRSRSKSSHKLSPAKERFDMFAVMRERANRLAELKSQGIPDGSLGSLLLSSVQSLPVPTPDPSSIPLPHKESLPTDSTKDEVKEEGSAEVEVCKTTAAAPAVEDSIVPAQQDQDAMKSKDANKTKPEEGNEKGKAKTIITIKSLKDSLVFQQAQEEAERKAKEKVVQPVVIESSCPANTEEQQQQQQQQEETSNEQQEEEVEQSDVFQAKKETDNENTKRAVSEESDRKRKGDKKEKGEEEERKDEEKQGEKQTHSKSADTQKRVEKEAKETENIQMEEEEVVKSNRNYLKRKAVDDTEDKEDSKGDKHSGVEEKAKGNKQSSKVVKEEDKYRPSSKVESEETKNKPSSISKDKESRESKSSSKKEEKEETRRSKSSKAEEEKDKGSKHSRKAEDEEEVSAKKSHKAEEKDKLSKHSNKSEEKDAARNEESKKNKVSRKLDEKEDEPMNKLSIEIEELEKSNESKPCSKDESGKNGHVHPDQDLSDKVEEGEIVSDKEEVVTKSTSKTHSKKKSKKDKSSTKEKKKSHRDKSKNKDEKKKAREKKKEHDQGRSRSKDRHKSKQQSSSSSKEHSHSRRHRRRSHSRSGSRSHSRDRSSRQHRRSHSRSRSKSRSKRRRESTSDLRDKVTRKRLLEIARRNAVYLMQNGCLPPSVEQEQLVKIKAGGKSVDELTDFCKQLVASGNYSDVDMSEPSMSSEEENNSEKPFSSTRHPFSVRDSKPILMNIRNAPMLPTKTNAERLAGQAKLREQFPVSSGSQHRTKGEMSSSDGKHLSESEWVPVPPKEKKEEDKVFTKPEVPPVDISQIVSTRLSAMRKLQDNPNDSEAIKTLNNVQKEMQNWALSKQEPGQFTGTTGVKVLSQEELSSGHQAWARKEQFKEAAPVRPQFGLKMLQKMGWSPGEGLGKNKEGTTEPLLLDVKMDKKGFHAQEEVTPKKQPVPLVKDLSGKHPVSALVELCSKRKWSPPDFEMVFDCGPDHKKNFLMKVMVNGQEFKPSVAASTKKMAKANAAAAYLQSLGLYPKDPHYPL